MFKKIKNIKNTVIIAVSVFLVFIIGSVIFLIVSNIRISKTLDRIDARLNYIYGDDYNLE